MKYRSNAGYTLIELLTVVALSSLLLITVTSLFFTTLLGGGKTATSEYTKQAGNYALGQMTYMIRNSRKLVANSDPTPVICQAGMQSLGVQSQDNNTTIFSLDSNRIASNSGKYLLPADIQVVTGSLRFDCNPTSYGTSSWDGSLPSVTISFSLRKGTVGVDSERDIVELPFQSSVTLRNY